MQLIYGTICIDTVGMDSSAIKVENGNFRWDLKKDVKRDETKEVTTCCCCCKTKKVETKKSTDETKGSTNPFELKNISISFKKVILHLLFSCTMK